MRDYSNYEKTGNNAIDIVAQAVGWAKANRKPIKSVTLSRSQYGLFWAGMEILRQEPFPTEHFLTFEGIPVLRGEPGQFDTITIQYINPKMN